MAVDTFAVLIETLVRGMLFVTDSWYTFQSMVVLSCVLSFPGDCLHKFNRKTSFLLLLRHCLRAGLVRGAGERAYAYPTRSFLLLAINVHCRAVESCTSPTKKLDIGEECLRYNHNIMFLHWTKEEALSKN